MQVNIDDVIKAYIGMRDSLEAKERQHKEALLPLRDKMRKVELWLQNQLQSQSLSNVKSESGTAFLQGVSSVTVQDWESLLGFIRENNLWELLDHRVSKSVVEDYLESTGNLPPGVNHKKETVVRIRRG
jgi:hypothetical protein